MKRRIIAFHQDEIQDWVANLDCGHKQHVRHNPPWMNRPWVTTPEGRESFIGSRLNCTACDEKESDANRKTSKSGMNKPLNSRKINGDQDG
jgi:Protein of unknown function (DUF3565)